MPRKKLTKEQVLQMFREVHQGAFERGDDIARREAWNNYTDMLCKNGEISVKQYENWSNPF